VRLRTVKGLEQEFSSLDAQREAGEAYIQTQKHAGWYCLSEHYNDGGFSGASIERPALQRLLADVDAGRIDVVVVYKVDRLSRSLLDFAKLMERFDKHNVAFVSVIHLRELRYVCQTPIWAEQRERWAEMGVVVPMPVSIQDSTIRQTGTRS